LAVPCSDFSAAGYRRVPATERREKRFAGIQHQVVSTMSGVGDPESSEGVSVSESFRAGAKTVSRHDWQGISATGCTSAKDLWGITRDPAHGLDGQAAILALEKKKSGSCGPDAKNRAGGQKRFNFPRKQYEAISTSRSGGGSPLDRCSGSVTPPLRD